MKLLIHIAVAHVVQHVRDVAAALVFLRYPRLAVSIRTLVLSPVIGVELGCVLLLQAPARPSIGVPLVLHLEELLEVPHLIELGPICIYIPAQVLVEHRTANVFVQVLQHFLALRV